MALSNCSGVSCCVVKILNGNWVKDALLHHYSRVVCANSECVTFDFKEEQIDSDSKYQVCQDGNGLSTTRFVRRRMWFPTEDLCCSCNDAAVSDNACLKGFPILWNNAKIQMNQDQRLCMCDWSAVSKIKDRLDFAINFTSSGVAFPNLYVWRSHSSFVWHLTETHLQSTDEQHSTSKFWFLVPVKYLSFFHYYVTDLLNLQVGCTTSRTFIDCGTNEVAPKEIEILMIAHNHRELLVLCHSGCTNGPAIADAVCYATEVRCLGGVLAAKGQHSPVASLLTACLPDRLLEANRNRKVVLQDSPSSTAIESTSLCDTPHYELPLTSQEIEIDEIALHSLSPLMKEENANGEDAQEMDRNLQVKRGRETGCVWEHMLLVQCPQCDKSYKGSADRLQRLLIHATRCHKGNEKNVVRQIIEKYYSLIPLLVGAEKKKRNNHNKPLSLSARQVC